MIVALHPSLIPYHTRLPWFTLLRPTILFSVPGETLFLLPFSACAVPSFWNTLPPESTWLTVCHRIDFRLLTPPQRHFLPLTPSIPVNFITCITIWNSFFYLCILGFPIFECEFYDRRNSVWSIPVSQYLEYSDIQKVPFWWDMSSLKYW